MPVFPRASFAPYAILLLGACTPARPALDEPGAVRAVLISDLNASYGSTHYPAEVGLTITHIMDSWRPDFVLIAGDMVAGQSAQLSDSAVWAMWAAFDSVVAAPLRTARIPIVMTMGNHDASAYPAHSRDRRIATEYWRRSLQTMPHAELASQEHYPLRYTFTRGNVFVAVWDATNQESATSDELLLWLQQVLSSPEALQSRHRVVLGHLPLYAVAVGRDRPGEVLARGDMLRRQLESWGATHFISGHHHAYYPGRRGGMELLHAGALGEGTRPLLGSTAPSPKTTSVLDFLTDSVVISTYVISAERGVFEPLPTSGMPPAICSSIAWVARRDLAAVDTTCGR